MRRYPRLDLNQNDIVWGLRDFGASVTSTASVGSGFPDIVVGYRGRNFLFEIKDPKKPPSQRTLTEHELVWHAGWRGTANVIESLSQAIGILTAPS